MKEKERAGTILDNYRGNQHTELYEAFSKVRNPTIGVNLRLRREKEDKHARGNQVRF